MQTCHADIQRRHMHAARGKFLGGGHRDLLDSAGEESAPKRKGRAMPLNSSLRESRVQLGLGSQPTPQTGPGYKLAAELVQHTLLWCLMPRPKKFCPASDLNSAPCSLVQRGDRRKEASGAAGLQERSDSSSSVGAHPNISLLSDPSTGIECNRAEITSAS